MPRRAEIPVRELSPDPVHNSRLVSQVINRVMTRGKKSTAEQIVYGALNRVGEQTGKPPVEVLEQAIKTITPVLEVLLSVSSIALAWAPSSNSRLPWPSTRGKIQTLCSSTRPAPIRLCRKLALPCT